MIETELKITDREELKRYLYAELSEDKKLELEEKFFLDDELFYEAADLENELIDLFARNKLSGTELKRFENALEKFPDRGQKIANAKALQIYIEEENQARESKAADIETLQIENRQFFRQKLASLFTIKPPVFGSVMAVLLVVSTITGFLLYSDSRRKGEELARLQSETESVRDLQNKIDIAEKRITELNNQLENKDVESDELIKTLGSEQQEIQELRRNLEKLRQGTVKAVPASPKPSAPTIASILLMPTLGSRGSTDGGKIKTASLGADTKKLAVSLSLPDEVKKGDELSILLNEKPFRQKILPRILPDGKKSVSLTIPISNLPDGANKLTVNNFEGKEITKYIFNVDKTKN